MPPITQLQLYGVPSEPFISRRKLPGDDMAGCVLSKMVDEVNMPGFHDSEYHSGKFHEVMKSFKVFV